MATAAAPLVGTTGFWPGGEPELVQIAGRTFQRAGFRFFRSGVTAQYREVVPQRSLHLLVLDDGTYRIDHQDDWNPDQGAPLEHLVSDFIPSRTGVLFLLGLLIVGVGLVLSGGSRSRP